MQVQKRKAVLFSIIINILILIPISHSYSSELVPWTTITDTAKMAQDADCGKLALVHLLPITIEALSESLTVIKKIFLKEILVPHDLMILGV